MFDNDIDARDLVVLLAPLWALLSCMVRCGTTLSKVKSRYGIETDTELKMLRVLRRGDVRAIKVTPKTLDATRFRIVCQLLIQRRPPAVRRRFTVLLPLLWAHVHPVPRNVDYGGSSCS